VKTLFLDLGSHRGLLACVGSERIEASTEVDHRSSDAELVPAIEALLSGAGWTWDDCERLACVTGPGGFTSLRVGVSVCNALSWGRGIPVAGVHLSDLWRARADAEDVVWLHSTKARELFARGFGAEKERLPTAELFGLDELLALLRPGTRWVGELLPAHREAAEGRGAARADVAPLDRVLPRFLAAQSYAPGRLEPWYGRGY